MTSQALNRPVDVLAVMQSAKYRCDCRPGVDHCTPCLEMGAARAAVSKLIEALSDCVTDMQQTEDFYGTHPRAQEVIAKAKAALAAIGAQP